MMEICLKAENPMPAFFPVLQQGVDVEVPGSQSLESIITNVWGFDKNFAATKIGTVFLNGTPVDDMESTRVGDGDVVALSGPMPGLAGAILRKGSPFAGLRRGGRPETRSGDSGNRKDQIRIHVKLFNSLIGDMGPRLLQTGVILDSERARGVVASLSQQGGRGFGRMVVDGKTMSVDEVQRILREKPQEPTRFKWST
ncbi:hypothetical protein SAMN02745206_03057 [Desulfacinum infernum DSM 9756]|uniref:ThiS family protein n=1 Tax=Desulfacinum infernum DSM 9756 TaxID=1121391 RepID=A0A1M5G6Q9_9BACT|nr:hypothetical protein [Desulfacinum infernum]SHF99132.1 hypothetical protein SAMN02745206_03057 [Desulfacinum infernum DSM 9756]